LDAGALPLSWYYTPQTVRIKDSLQIFTIRPVQVIRAPPDAVTGIKYFALIECLYVFRFKRQRRT
jgi:hypothetical protein